MLEDLQALSGGERKHPTDECQVDAILVVGLLVRRRIFPFTVSACRAVLCHVPPQTPLLGLIQLYPNDPSPVALQLIGAPERDTLCRGGDRGLMPHIVLPHTAS